MGYDALAETVAPYTPEKAAAICGIEPDAIRRAAEILGSAERLMSTALQGVYQSHQATAAAVPGQQHQPVARHDRQARLRGAADERPADGPEHARDRRQRRSALHPQLAKPGPCRATRRALERRAAAASRTGAADARDADLPLRREGSIRFLWIVGTNPAVSLPELARIRTLLAKDDLFLVVQDAFLTETAELADVVLPAPWGEKTGTFTNADRTIHCPRRRSSRRVRRAPTSTSSSTTRGAWASPTRTASR